MVQSVNLVDEQHIALPEARQETRPVTGPRDHRAGGRHEAAPALGVDEPPQRRLAEPGPTAPANKHPAAQFDVAPRCGSPRKRSDSGTNSRMKTANTAGNTPSSSNTRQPE